MHQCTMGVERRCCEGQRAKSTRSCQFRVGHGPQVANCRLALGRWPLRGPKGKDFARPTGLAGLVDEPRLTISLREPAGQMLGLQGWIMSRVVV